MHHPALAPKVAASLAPSNQRCHQHAAGNHSGVSLVRFCLGGEVADVLECLLGGEPAPNPEGVDGEAEDGNSEDVPAEGELVAGPWRPSRGIELGVRVSKELKYEIAPRPSRYGQNQPALRQSSDSVRAFVSVSIEIVRSAKPIRIATISFQTTAQPVKSRISLATTNAAGATSDAAGSRNGRGRAGS